MLTLCDIIATLQRHWSAEAPGDIPTRFPGVLLDASQLPAWIEFWTTELREQPYRESHPNSLWLVVDVHCFSRDRNKRRVTALADVVRNVLSHGDVPISSADDPDLRIGLIRFREPVVRDLTREDPQHHPLPLQHAVVSLRAVAESDGGSS